MGFNTTVVVMNDYLSSIGADANFGKNLGRAIRQAAIERPVDVHALGGVRAAVVVASHQSFEMLPVLVGANTGVPLHLTVPLDPTPEGSEKELLFRLAQKHGYTLRKRPR